MKRILMLIICVVALSACCNKQSQLRHVVFFGFEESLTQEQIKEIEDAFCALPSQISQIKGYEWGTDCSPEGLQKGHTHCFFLTFDTEQDRNDYLGDPAHKKFGELVSGKLKNVTVIDYFVK